MWNWIVRTILRNRIAILVIVGILTIFLGYKGIKVQMSYEMARLLPESDTTYQSYIEFKERFGEDGKVMVVGVTNPNIFKIDEFNAWYDLSEKIKKVEGVEQVLSLAQAISLEKDTTLRKFKIETLVKQRPVNQTEVDDIKNRFMSLPLYQGFLYNAKTNACLMAITLNQKNVNAKGRVIIVNKIKDLVDQYKNERKTEVHCSGLPYIRTVTAKMIENELFLFIILSMAVAAVIMFLFFRSFKVVISSMLVVVISIFWVLGITALFGYKITILTGVIPSLIVIIVIENCIYILNKYHWEYAQHGNKIRALSRTIKRIGFASLMTNMATAMGFAAFIIVDNQLLSEFGVVTSINIMVEYFLTITLFPILFSFMAPPSEKHIKHLDSRIFGGITNSVVNLITNHRKKVYLTTLLFVVVAIWGLTLMKTSGKVVDDLAVDDPVYVDLKYFENNFGGVMPFEVAIDTKKKNGVLRLQTIKKIEELGQYIEQYPEFTKPLSLAEMTKFAKQAFYGGDSTKYTMPSEMEKNFIMAYIPQSKGGGNDGGLFKSYLDSASQFTRVSFQMTDIGTKEMKNLLEKVKPGIDSIFPPDKYNVTITGSSVVYAKGTEFLINNLFISVAIAILLISVLMSLMFRSVKMIMVSMVPNLIPLLITAAIMGFSNIPLKPSTLIVFSIALGISVDNAIQYLARYRHELKLSNNNIGQSAIRALREASFSMFYTSIVLVLGFSVFMISNFGGTKALGLLISCTLFVAVFFNVIVLPSLLMSLDKRIVTKAFTEEPLIDVYDDEEEEHYPKKSSQAHE